MRTQLVFISAKRKFKGLNIFLEINFLWAWNNNLEKSVSAYVTKKINSYLFFLFSFYDAFRRPSNLRLFIHRRQILQVEGKKHNAIYIAQINYVTQLGFLCCF